MSGRLSVTKSGDLLTLNFPSQRPERCDIPKELAEGLGKASDELSSLSQSIREQGFSALTNSLEEIKSESKSNYQKLNKLILGGFAALTLIQLMVLGALIQHL